MSSQVNIADDAAKTGGLQELNLNDKDPRVCLEAVITAPAL